MKALSRARRTQIATELVARYYINKNYSVHLEVGLNSGGRLRADVLAMNAKGHVVIVEVKSSWEDFATDNKWYKYLDFCNKFYFCIPDYLYDSDKGQFIKQLCREKKVGLIVVGSREHDWVNVRVINNRLRKIDRVILNIPVGCGDTEVCQENQFWLFRKLAWRGGLCVANVKKSSEVICEIDSEYEYDKPMSSYQFANLDPLQQANYLKKFPKSGFKSEVQQLGNRIISERKKLKRIKKRNKGAV